MDKERISSESDDLLERIYDVPGEVATHIVFINPGMTVSESDPFQLQRSLRGVKIYDVDLVNSARQNPESYYHTLNERDLGIMELRFPRGEIKRLTFAQIGEIYGMNKGSVASIVNRIKNKLNGELLK